ncbi:MAG: hypothetical protein IPJ17_09260 [Holophagales bacterium]|nr:MAG: hypothetical protein IPJ17_09260 [Holophagales bacterium]
MEKISAEVRRRTGAQVDWIVVGRGEQDETRVALEATLRRRFGEEIEAVALSDLDRPPAVAWIEVRPAGGTQRRSGLIRDVASQCLGLLGLDGVEVVVGNPQDLPASAVVLRAVKKTAPASGREVGVALQDLGFEISEKWLRSRLDTLRRKGLIVRHANGDYSLTDEGGRLVPHGDFRASSDIERVLALARRRW